MRKDLFSRQKHFCRTRGWQCCLTALFLLLSVGIYAQVLVIDLTTENQVTITATSEVSSGTISGPTTTGFYLENVFASAGTQTIGTTSYVGTPTLTPASVPTDNSPALYRFNTTEPGLNIWSYSTTTPTTFTTGLQAFSGEATWSISAGLYNALLTAPASGNVYFPADDVSDLATATLIGTYSVTMPGGTGGDGCLDAPNGQYPAATYTPTCDGTAHSITTAAWTGEYSLVQVTAGTEYTFTSSVDTDFVTIGNEDGTVAFASGVTPLTWTADADQAIRFYLHFDSDCNWAASGLRSRIVECSETPPPPDGCLDAPNGQYPAATYTPTCDGTAHSITTAAWTGEYSLVQVTAGTEYTFTSSVDTDFVTIGNEDGTVAFASGVTPLTWTADADQAIRFYLHFDSDCNWAASGLRSRIVECSETPPPPDGCLDAPNGQYPAATYTPACAGTPEAITTAAWTGEYSLVQVTAGTEYTFSSSVDTDFVTIGNEDGTVALASGTTPVTWTADADQLIRFYLHFDSDCNWAASGLRSRIIQCGEQFVITEPDFPCFQGDGLASNGPENGYGVNPTDIYRVADDFFVDAGTEFVLQQVSLNVLSSSAVTSATINIHEDDGGAPSATLAGSFTMAPTESNIFGAAFGFPAYNLKFDLASPITLPEGTYWLEPTISNSGNTTIYWEMTSIGSHGAIVELSNTSGDSWVPDDSGLNYQAVFFVAGECNTIAEPDGCLDAENGQYPSATFVPSCSGDPETITALAWTGEYSLVQVTAGTEYTFSSSVDTDFVTIGNEDGTVALASGTTPVTWTADSDQLIRFYLHFDSDCNWAASGLRSRIIQCAATPPPPDGCLDAENGQYPSATFVPSCSGAPETITALAWTGEYSLVQVTAGTEYTFSSSVNTDFVTIGNEDGTVVLAAGTTPVTWTADADQLIRFYLHFDSDCNWAASGLRSRIIQCGDIPPAPANDDCANAIALSCGDSDSGSTVGANDSGGNAAGDVFYKFTGTGTPQLVTVSLCGSAYDTYLRVFSDCTLADEIVFNDDSCGLQSQLQFLSDGTSTYIIMVEGFSANTGDYTINLSCADAPEPGEGCLNATYGQYPANTFVPACIGTPQSITDIAYAGEYSMVQVTAGTEYIFSSSVGTDFLTIGNEAGDTVLAYGVTPLTWTADADQLVRFYTHVNDACMEDTNFRSRFVQCGEIPPPPSACEDYVVLSNNLENGLFFEGTTAQHLAVDIPVGDTGFTIYGMEPTLIGTATTFNFRIYEDAGGLPGGLVYERTGTYYGDEYTGTNFGYDFFKYTIGFAEGPIDLDANTIYWIELQSDAVAWESESVLTLGYDDVFYNTNVGEGVWTPTGGDQFVFNLVCTQLGVSDMNSFNFTYYPNPVKDYLTIDAKKNIENISIYNLAGQSVLQGVKAVDGKVNMSSLSPGVYVFRVTLEGGQVETFKIVKK